MRKSLISTEDTKCYKADDLALNELTNRLAVFDFSAGLTAIRLAVQPRPRVMSVDRDVRVTGTSLFVDSGTGRRPAFGDNG